MKGCFTNKSAFIHFTLLTMLSSQCPLFFFCIRFLVTVQRTNNKFTYYHHKLHFHTNIQMAVKISPRFFVKERRKPITDICVHPDDSWHFINSFKCHISLFRITSHVLLKNTEFKNDLIPAIVTSHLQKRLSNYHYPHKEGFSLNDFLLNTKLFMYLKILEVFKMRTQFMARSYVCTNTN